jgi:type II secretory pathway pseudopilin PulG
MLFHGGGRAAGFLLIEMAVALLIVGMAFGYGFASLSGALDRLGRDHSASAALLLAQSTLDRVGYDIPLGQDDVGGRTPDGYSWSVRTAPYPLAPATMPVVGYVVRVTVGWRDRLRSRQVGLSTVRLAMRGKAG